MAFAETDRQARVAAFREGLQKARVDEGRNIGIDYRWARSTRHDRMPRWQSSALQPQSKSSSHIGHHGSAGCNKRDPTIPIVFTGVADPIGSGFVTSFPRPGGNVTGFIILEPR